MTFLPTFHFVEIATSDNESRTAKDKENASRYATAELTQQSKGIGQQRLPQPLVFPVIFRDEPHMTYGSAVITGANTAQFQDPRGSSGVWGWQRNKRGYFTGAYLWVRVDCERLGLSATSQAYGNTVAELQAIGTKDLSVKGSYAYEAALAAIARLQVAAAAGAPGGPLPTAAQQAALAAALKALKISSKNLRDYKKALDAAKATSTGSGVNDLNKVVVQHYMTFSGVAIKQLPKITSAALNPRTVGI